jgi:2-keto-3-deoxy-L-rhamnonate aldolase RhmA
VITNPLRQALLRRETSLGSWVQIGHEASVEILANAGFDWIAVDCEHSDIDIVVLSRLLRGMYGRGSVPVVRVKDNDTLAIRQALDMGAHGVLVPLIGNAKEACKAVAAAKYPPKGIRGHCYSRMNNYGEDFDEYTANANDNVCVVAMIETKEGVQNIKEILAVDGLDGVFIGPYDLSGSYGVPGETTHPLVMKARQEVLLACEEIGKSAGLHIVHPSLDTISTAIRDGFNFIALGADIIFLREASQRFLKIGRSVEAQIAE